MRSPGSVVAHRYELVEKIGEGGMATVWNAVVRGAAGFVRPVAVKQIKPEYRQLKNYVAMFVEEARVGSELAHPNIVQVFDFCEDEHGYYLIMEWVEGVDLASFVRAFGHMRQPMPWPLAAAVGIGVLQGLAAAHERKSARGEPAPVIHRDISPHNILLGRSGVAKLSDFGLARARDRMFSLTAPGTVKGKLGYLAPEITTGKPASAASDLFAMGSVLWEALAGRRLFDGDCDIDVFAQIRKGDIAPIAGARPDLPPRVVEVIERALAVDPRARFAGARQMAHELGECLRSADEYVDTQALIATSVGRARDVLAEREGRGAALGASELDQPTWTFEIDADSGSLRSPAGSQTIRPHEQRARRDRS